MRYYHIKMKRENARNEDYEYMEMWVEYRPENKDAEYVRVEKYKDEEKTGLASDAFYDVRISVTREVGYRAIAGWVVYEKDESDPNTPEPKRTIEDRLSDLEHNIATVLNSEYFTKETK